MEELELLILILRQVLWDFVEVCQISVGQASVVSSESIDLSVGEDDRGFGGSGGGFGGGFFVLADDSGLLVHQFVGELLDGTTLTSSTSSTSAASTARTATAASEDSYVYHK